ncbi:MAG TPA: glycosyltransferase [Candidatus Limnocylindrales bacterium]|nr:glycosyltransferase [Candidatus Limnocylindrales bacterium]
MSNYRSIDINNAVVIVDFSMMEKNATMRISNKITNDISQIANNTAIFKRLYNNLIRSKFERLPNYSKPQAIAPIDQTTMRGAGVNYKTKRYITHSTLPFSLSALKTFSTPQKIIMLGLLLLSIFGFTTSAILTFQILVSVLSILYFTDVVFNLVVVLRSLQSADEITFEKSEIYNIDDKKLPIYTLLCPLYKEAHIFPQFLSAINKLDYPKEKLDVLLLLEEDDVETIKILDKMTLPYYIKKLIVPNSLPKTKPKACNYGLSFAKGEYLVIFDAEDIPDPLQLKKAYLAFKKVPKDVQCLQAKLNYYNPRANVLTRFFTVEYALWFDIMLTGLQSFNSTLPLGGTSNHFKTKKLKELHGWDPFNVTEDADLGVRLFQKGYRTAVIDSVTLEEATSETKNWIRQRSRWLKGYMQTYFVHTRNYKDFIDQKGILHYIIFQFTVGGKVLFILINPLMWVITLLYFTSYSFAGQFLETIYAPPVSYIAVVSWIFGNFLFVYYYMIACGRKKEWDLMKYVFLIPVYWALMSFAGAIALYQLILKPHYWEKTTHGMHLASKYKKYSLDKKLSVHPVFQGILTQAYSVITSIKINILGAYNLLTTSVPEKSPNKRNHILIYNWRDTSHIYAGGAEVYIHELARRWVQEGSRVTIFCGNDNRSVHNEKVDGVEVVRRGGTYSVYIFGFLYYFFKFRGKVDLVVDCENGIPFFTPLYARVPVILLIHHVHQEIFRVFLKFPLRQIAEFMEGTLMPLVYKNKQIVTVSNSSMNEIIRMGFTDSKKIKIIPNGVTGMNFSSQPKTLNPSLLYLGRLKNYKNIDIAIKAFTKVVAEFSNAKFTIVGSGESYVKLNSLVKKLKLEKNIIFLGRVSEEEKARQLSQSWAVVQPSQMEGWGITVIEANANGTPVIASRVSGLVDSVIDGQTGILVEPKHIDHFAHAIKNIFGDKALRKTLSENAFEWAKNFNWDTSASNFQKLIHGLIQEEEQSKAARVPIALSKTKKPATSI